MPILSDEERKLLIAAGKSLDELKILTEQLTHDEILASLIYCRYYILHYAVKCGHVDIIKYLLEFFPKDKIPEILKDDDYGLLRDAVKNGHLEATQLLVELESSPYPNMLRSATGFRIGTKEAAAGGHVLVLRYLIPMVKDNSNREWIVGQCLTSASENGHISLYQELIAFLGKFKLSIRYDNLTSALWRGHIELGSYILSLIPEDYIKKRLIKGDLNLLDAAATGGHLEVMKLIVSLSPKKKINELLVDSRHLIHYAIISGNVDMLRFIIDLAKKNDVDVHDLIKWRNYSCLGVAIQEKDKPGFHENIIRIKLILENIPQGCWLSAMEASKFRAFSNAIKNNDLDVVKYFVSIFPEHLNDMVSAYLYNYDDTRSECHLYRLIPKVTQVYLASLDIPVIRKLSLVIEIRKYLCLIREQERKSAYFDKEKKCSLFNYQRCDQQLFDKLLKCIECGQFNEMIDCCDGLMKISSMHSSELIDIIKRVREYASALQSDAVADSICYASSSNR